MIFKSTSRRVFEKKYIVRQGGKGDHLMPRAMFTVRVKGERAQGK